MPSSVANTLMLRRLRPIWTKPPRFTVSRWADKRRFLSRESSSLPGRYRSALAPYQREPMDSVLDPTVQSTTLMFGSQLGKSEVELNIAGYFIDCDPSPILAVMPTIDDAESWSKTRLAPMLRDSPCFHGKVREPRSRDSGNTVLSKIYLGGDIAIVGANAPSGLAARPRRVVLMDEIDRFPFSAGSEGDPCALAERRTESFWNAVIFRSSSPTIKGLSRIEKAFEETDKREWFCPCPECRQHQTLKWRQVLWGQWRVESIIERDKLTPEAGQKLLAGIPDDGSDAVYECEHCHVHLPDAQRLKMVRAGEWRATAPFKGKRGYHLSGLCSPFKAKKGFKTRLHQMVAHFLEAKRGGRETMKAWTNTFLGESFEDEEALKIEPSALLRRSEDESYSPDKLPEDVIIVGIGMDVQADRLEIEVVGVGLDDETWGIEAFQLFGNTEQDEVWQEASDALAKTYLREDGVTLPVTFAACDMRHKPHKVRQWLKACGHPRAYPVYGVGGDQPLLVTTRWNKHYRLRTYAVCAKAAKDVLFARLAVEEPGPRHLHFPKGHGYTEEYFAQLTAEVLKTRYVYGFQEKHYVKTRDRNEALDRRVYFLAGLDILKPNLTAIARRLKQATPPPSPAREAGTPAPSVPTNRGPSGPPRRRIRVGRW